VRYIMFLDSTVLIASRRFSRRRMRTSSRIFRTCMSTSDIHTPRSLHSLQSLLIIPRCRLAGKYGGMNKTKRSEPKETKATKWQISRHLQSKALKNVVLFHKKLDNLQIINTCSLVACTDTLPGGKGRAQSSLHCHAVCKNSTSAKERAEVAGTSRRGERVG
jgi:hypothetical protein